MGVKVLGAFPTFSKPPELVIWNTDGERHEHYDAEVLAYYADELLGLEGYSVWGLAGVRCIDLACRALASKQEPDLELLLTSLVNLGRKWDDTSQAQLMRMFESYGVAPDNPSDAVVIGNEYRAAADRSPQPGNAAKYWSETYMGPYAELLQEIQRIQQPLVQ